MQAAHAWDVLHGERKGLPRRIRVLKSIEVEPDVDRHGLRAQQHLLHPRQRGGRYPQPEVGHVECDDPPAATDMGDSYPANVVGFGGWISSTEERHELEDGDEELGGQTGDRRRRRCRCLVEDGKKRTLCGDPV